MQEKAYHIEPDGLQSLRHQRSGERTYQGTMNQDDQAIYTLSSIASRLLLMLNIAAFKEQCAPPLDVKTCLLYNAGSITYTRD
jgi:hypothetical protein